ncbi:hypothetical protein DPMN_135857 [Dreissena polymorpha]|uniref:Myb/SANT-like DNA-binding domain-containing protein n=2 Tax=Dreissena polymorpha TaxID=45954 RepID=A0A9D4JG61_DREPO|nr:hypothetical protein DPMN_135857 [Dreissena polymorpha]
MPRSDNVSEFERLCLFEQMINNYDDLYGQLKGSNGKAMRGEIWKSIWADLRSTGKLQGDRTVEEVMKMFANPKTRVRDKFKNSQKTGGGPAKPFKPSEELILQFLIDRPQLDGIIGGIET